MSITLGLTPGQINEHKRRGSAPAPFLAAAAAPSSHNSYWMNNARCEHAPGEYCQYCLYLYMNSLSHPGPLTTPHRPFVPGISFGQYRLPETINTPIAYPPPDYPPPGRSPMIQPPPERHAQRDLPQRCYPEDSEESRRHRASLVTLLQSRWYIDRQPEPPGALDRFIYEHGPNQFVCSVHGCQESRDRLDRMRDHVRVHLDHRPYPCSGCHISTCTARFCTKETRNAHEKIDSRRTRCSNCGQTMDKKNLKRHLDSERCKRCRGGEPNPHSHTGPSNAYQGSPTV